MNDEPKIRVRCPNCGRDDSLYEEAVQSGYYRVDEFLERTSGFESDFAWDEGREQYGCGECDWTGGRRMLEHLGLDGEPLPYIHRGQLDIYSAFPRLTPWGSEAA
jgi:hypothetical protein